MELIPNSAVIITSVVNPLGSIFDYVFNWEKKIEALKKEMKDLECKWEDVKRQVDNAEKRGLTPFRRVEVWIDDVKSLDEEIRKMEDFLEMEGFVEGAGRYPNICQRIELSERAIKHLEVARDLNRKGDELVDRQLAMEDFTGGAVTELEQLRKQYDEQTIVFEQLRKQRDELYIDLQKANEQLHRENALRGHEQVTTDTCKIVNFSQFSYSELQQATLDFHESSKIGEGGYGSVYKGYLHHTAVAIKMLNPQSVQGKAAFDREVDVLSKMRHPNLVTLIGACPEVSALVYDFLSNGSLEDRLKCKDGTPPLSWQARTRIANEIRSALVFLHSHEPAIVVHGDLKPANILLDANYVSKLGDFGICRLIARSNTTSTIFLHTQPKGTPFYVDPVFVDSWELTTLSDVYSFGIIILQLLTGRHAEGIAKEVQTAMENGSLYKILDASAGNWPIEESNQLAKLALRCCDPVRKNRPDLAGKACQLMEPMMKAATSIGSSSPFR